MFLFYDFVIKIEVMKVWKSLFEFDLEIVFGISFRNVFFLKGFELNKIFKETHETLFMHENESDASWRTFKGRKLEVFGVLSFTMHRKTLPPPNFRQKTSNFMRYLIFEFPLTLPNDFHQNCYGRKLAKAK